MPVTAGDDHRGGLNFFDDYCVLIEAKIREHLERK